jgi:hypothetical protein
MMSPTSSWNNTKSALTKFYGRPEPQKLEEIDANQNTREES